MDSSDFSVKLKKYIWPQIHAMLLSDAYFKLIGRAREITGEFNGPIGRLIEDGYVISQTIAIRRLCDSRKDTISIIRLLVKARDSNHIMNKEKIEPLSQKLEAACRPICELANNYVAHTANPLCRQNVGDWNLQVDQITEAQKAICEAAVIFDRDLLQGMNYVKLVPVPQSNIMQEFKNLMSDEDVAKLWEFWHAHNEKVNGWIPEFCS